MTRRRSAFTLIEVLIVIAIIVALSGLVGIALFSKQKDAKKDLARADLNTIKRALQSFHLKYDRYPTDQEGLEVLWSKDKLDAEADATKWAKELESPLPKDRWDQPWGYRQVSEHGAEDEFDLWSNGPDKQEGTDDDITSWAGSSGPGGEPSGSGSGGEGGKSSSGGS